MGHFILLLLSFFLVSGSGFSGFSLVEAAPQKKLHSRITVQSVCSGEVSYSYTDEWGMERQDLVPKTHVFLNLGPREKLIQTFLRVKGESRASAEILSGEDLQRRPQLLREIAAVCLGRSSSKDLKKSELANFKKRISGQKSLRIATFHQELTQRSTRLEAYVLKNHQLKPVRLHLRGHAGS